MILDSAAGIQSHGREPSGRFSFWMAEPIVWIEIPVTARDVFQQLRALQRRFKSRSLADVPGFQGGLAGFFSYEICRSTENIRSCRFNDFGCAAASFGVYDSLIGIDHLNGGGWIISHGWASDPLLETGQTSIEIPDFGCRELARSRADFLFDLLVRRDADWIKRSSWPTSSHNIGRRDVVSHSEGSHWEANARGPRMALDMPLFSLSDRDSIQSNFSREDYLRSVQRGIDYIRAGDIFQVNLSQQLIVPARQPSIELFLELRRVNPAPFAAYLDLGAMQLVSASPERLVRVKSGIVETRPIKGTRARTRFPEVDLDTAKELARSEKDRAENVMIVDLMRNDLSQCCLDDSVVVTQLCQVEAFQSVLHLVSVVQGELRGDVDAFDLLAAILPGGSVTGAPKIRAMEIIAELELSSRGAYCGSLGYIGFDGTMDFNILIRTVTAAGGWWQIPVGGGIVAQSDPIGEYAETMTKAASMLQAINNVNESDQRKLSTRPWEV
jgi:para-aminobenzoate synthetase component 1